jgi:hypothetical protein
MAYSTDIKDYYRRAWGLGDRVPFKYGGTWADWASNYEDQMTFEEYLKDDTIVKKLHALDRKADGGRIGGGIISGEDYGNRTGFVEPKLIIGGSRTPLEFKGMHGVRTALIVPPNTAGYLGRTGEQAVFATKEDAQRFINEDMKKLNLETQKNKQRSPVMENRLEKIKNIYKNLKASGQKKVFLNDILDQLVGEKSVPGTGKRRIQTEQSTLDSGDSRSTFKKNIKEALGKEIYDTLIKTSGGDPRIVEAKKAKFNKLVLDVTRGDLPITALGSQARGTKANITKFLTDANKKRFNKILPKLRAINSRIAQPRQKYTVDDIKNINETTVKTFDKMIKNYPIAPLDRGFMLKSGQSFNDRSYILSQIDRHIGEGGNLYKHVSGDTHATIKFRNNQTGKLITYNNIDLTNPEFKEAADVYKQWDKIKNTKIDNPLKKGEKITIAKALEAGGDSLVKDHLDPEGVKGNPLKNLVISTQKANMAGQIKNKTPEQISAIGRGLNLSVEDNIKRYSKYGRRLLLNKAVDPEFKIKSPTKTIEEKGTVRGKAEAIKSKMDASRMFTSRIPGGAAVLAPADFVLSMVAEVPIYDAAASAGSYILKDPYLGKAVNVPLAIRAITDYGDADEMLQKAGERREKIESTVDKYTPKTIKNLLDFSLINYVKKIKKDKESGKTYEEGSEIDKSIELEKKGKELAETMSDTEIELRGQYPTASDEEIKDMLRKPHAKGGSVSNLSGVDQYLINRYK